MVEAVFAVAPKVLPDASFQNIANLAYGLAILNHSAPPELLTAVAEAALLRMPSASSHVRPFISLRNCQTLMKNNCSLSAGCTLPLGRDSV